MDSGDDKIGRSVGAGLTKKDLETKCGDLKK
jgi:hypothetical protein